jgi:hypothetical protein
MLVASSVSPKNWMRMCSYAGAPGVQQIQMDAAEACPQTSPQGAQRHARLDR